MQSLLDGSRASPTIFIGAPDGNGDDMVRHWKSLIDHICDTHENCYHLELKDRPVKYIYPGNIHHNVIYMVIISYHMQEAKFMKN